MACKTLCLYRYYFFLKWILGVGKGWTPVIICHFTHEIYSLTFFTPTLCSQRLSSTVYISQSSSLFGLYSNTANVRSHQLIIGWKEREGGFPGGAVVENLPANAGDTGSSPGPGRSHMPQSGWAREPQLLSLRVWILCSATREAAIVRGPHTVMKSGPRLPQLEKALAQKRRPNIAINQSIN